MKQERSASFVDDVVVVQAAYRCSFADAVSIVETRLARTATENENDKFDAATEARSRSLLGTSPRSRLLDQADDAASIPSGRGRPFSDEPWGIVPPVDKMKAGR